MQSISIQSFLSILKDSTENKTLSKLTLSRSESKNELKNIYVKPVLLKNEYKLSFTYRYKTKDTFLNLSITEAVEAVRSFLDKVDFLEANLITETKTIKIEFLKSQKMENL